MPKTRRIKNKPYSSFRLQKKVQVETKPLPSFLKITRDAFGLLRSRWKLFGGLLLVYLALNIVVVGGFSLGTNIANLQADAKLKGQTSVIGGSLSVFGSLISGNNAGTSAGSTYQFILIIIFSLAFMWALRQVQAKEDIGVKETIYLSSYPLIPFLIVLSVIFVQLLPLLAGNFVYSIAVNGGIALAAEKALWAILSGLLILLSLYMISSSVFALYIVTLPGVMPMQALRSAREIVRFRRFDVMRKIVALPIILGLAMAVIIVPLIIVAPPVAEVVAYVLVTSLLLLSHSYLYTLYRSLL